MSGGFSAWKARAVIRLAQLKRKYAGDEEVCAQLDRLVARLKRLRRRDLNSFLAELIALSGRVPELLEVVPAEEDAERWLREGGE